MISCGTNVYGIIGDPIGHSLSPSMHNAAFEELGLDCVYVAFQVPSELLSKAIEGVRSLGIQGLNVTIPHKSSVVNYLDDFDERVRKVGAANTIKNEDGRLIGFNTDGGGALKALEEEMGSVADKSVLLLGAGGAAMAISFSLVEAGADLVVSNRTASKAEELIDSIKKEVGVKVGQVKLEQKKLKETIAESDVLINATSVGMYPDVNETLITADMMHSDLVVKDLVYKPVRTRLLREAEKVGAKTMDGLGMLIHQAAASFELWTGRTAPVKVMKEAVEKSLRRQ